MRFPQQTPASAHEEDGGAANDWVHLEEGAPTRLQQPQQGGKQLSPRLTGLNSHLISSIKVDGAGVVLLFQGSNGRGDWGGRSF